MEILRKSSTLQISCMIALLLVLSSPGDLFGQDFLKQLEDKLGLPSQNSQSDNDSSSAENLPAPVRPSGSTPAPTDTTPPADPTAGVPALNPIPLPFEIEDGSSSPVTPDELTIPAAADRPYFGITVEPLQGGGMGLKIVDVTRDSPAWKAGISPGDQLMAIDSKALSSIDELASEILRHAPGDVLKCLIDRRGRTLTQPIVLGSSSLAEKSKIKLPNGLPPYNPIGTANIADSTTPPTDKRATLGITVERLSENTRQRYGIPVYRGAIVLEVAPNSPAMRAGLMPGDCIVETDGVVIQSEADLQTWMSKVVPGQIVNLQYFRGPNLSTAKIRLEPRTPTPTLQNSNSSTLDDNSNATVGTSTTANESQIQELESRIQAMQQELDKAHRELETLQGSR